MTTDVAIRHKEIALLELLDRVLDKGVIIAGDLTISVADIDLIYLGLRVLLCSVETMQQQGYGAILSEPQRRSPTLNAARSA